MKSSNRLDQIPSTPDSPLEALEGYTIRFTDDSDWLAGKPPRRRKSRRRPAGMADMKAVRDTKTIWVGTHVKTVAHFAGAMRAIAICVLRSDAYHAAGQTPPDVIKMHLPGGGSYPDPNYNPELCRESQPAKRSRRTRERQPPPSRSDPPSTDGAGAGGSEGGPPPDVEGEAFVIEFEVGRLRCPHWGCKKWCGPNSLAVHLQTVHHCAREEAKRINALPRRPITGVPGDQF